MPRLDQELHKRGLVTSRSKAARAIADGFVRVNGALAQKPGEKIDADADIVLDQSASKWVSRAALKLLPFMDRHEGAIALDLGASTGGFTQVLLEHGVRKVFAVDVGHDQLHPILQNDPRVLLREGLNARDLNEASFADKDWPKFDILTSDLSFISITKALLPAMKCADKGVVAYVLIKPQFELDPSKIGKGGLVKFKQDQQEAIQKVRVFFEKNEWEVLLLEPCPITGGDGNQEYMLKAQKR